MRIREAFYMDVDQRERAAKAREEHAQDGELVKMYRSLAKQLHPDAGQGDSAESVAIWHRVQQAYTSRNVSQMKSLLSMLGADEA
ncbi:MAG: hypothetical protein ACK55I_04305, partial [bacterium]